MSIKDILASQKDIGDRIKQVKEKFDYTQIESRNEGYANDRLETLKLLWDDFINNHQAIMISNDIDGGHSYFKDKFFQKIEELYLNLNEELKSIIKPYEEARLHFNFPPPRLSDIREDPSIIGIASTDIPMGISSNATATTGTTPKWRDLDNPHRDRVIIGDLFKTFDGTTTKLHNLSNGQPNKYHNYHEELKRFNDCVQTYKHKDPQNDPILNSQQLIFVQERLARKWEIIEMMHQRFMVDHSDYDAAPFMNLEEEFEPILFEYNSQRNKVKANLNNNPNRNNPQDLLAKLPKLQVPTFSDDWINYNSFKQLFMKMVGSRIGLDDVEKFAYLKGQLKGEALRLIITLPVENGSYQASWDALDARFDNKHKVITQLIQRLIDQKPMKSPAAKELKETVDIISQTITGLSNMGMPIDILSNSVFYFLVERKIHPAITRLYENTLIVPGTPRLYEEFMKFLQCRVQNASINTPVSNEEKSKVSTQNGKNNNNSKQAKSSTVLAAATVPATMTNQNKNNSNCGCKENHFLFRCPAFLALKPDARIKRSRELQRCINCLRAGHGVKDCKSKGCLKCNKKHNTLLHLELTPKSGETTSLIGSAVENKNFKHVFLATALIEVADRHGNPVVVRTLLDSGSQLNMITEKIHRKLGLSHQETNMKIAGVGLAKTESHKRVVINLKSKNSGFHSPLEVFVIKNVTTCQPAQEVKIDGWKIPKNIPLADPRFNTPAAVDLIIGGEIFYKLISIGQISIGKNLPELQNTVFGWVVIGKLLGVEQPESFVGIATQDPLEKQLAEFWKVEEKYQAQSKLTRLEQDCEKYFEDTTTRDAATGKFVVNLQFIKEPNILGNSENMAIRRFLYLEKKFERDPSMKVEYANFMQEYENLGHMTPVERHELGEKFYVIPHHAVRNPSSSTTKFRVVFDASAKTTSNISLNEILANGPMLQDDLFSIMVRFRQHRYVFSADITKMYRQIEVNPKDVKWQIIVWRKEPTQPIKYYKLNTLTYGTTCASYLAIKSLQTLADESKTEFPEAAVVAKRDFNVDDVMTGSDDLKQAIIIQEQLIDMCRKANFNLHKWCANHPILLEGIPRKKQEVSLEFGAEKTETKALGMKWIPKTDKFMLTYEPQEYKKITKRTVLSETAQLFDPLGLVNPVIVMAKIFMQELWALKLDWDAALPLALNSKWEEFRKELLKLNQVSVPRHMVIEDPVNIQLHAFADASTRAYGTAVYLRSVSKTGKIQVNLICSKSRVAPVNTTTLPRLELCAGMIMLELAEKLNSILEIKISETTYWTDSEVVLSWIFSDGSYKTFVANRIATIKRKSDNNAWKYVNTKLNPADLISRGVLPEKLIKSDLWWHGPQFLRKDKKFWPELKPAFIREPEEERTIKTVLIACDEAEHFIDRVNHRNSIRTLQRIIAYMMRFANRLSNRSTSNVSLTTEELQQAHTIIIRYCQQQSFREEIKLVKKGEGERTKFSNFVPILDADGILRVGGRLQAANVPFEQKHPALLPKDHFITRLMMSKIHLDNMHAGPQALLAITRQKYWPENGRRLAQQIVQQCVLCVRSKPKLMEQIMGMLPADRVNQARPFIHVGMDFGGPITIHYKLRGKRPTKAYICIFVCFTTKAVHIEAAADLTTEAFISCLKRFIARRGLPKKIFCDNATNFASASRQLGDLRELMQNQQHQNKVSRYCLDHQIEWKFIPPRSPHFGGLHEAAIKSAKLHLHKVLHAVAVTYDELITVLAEIEAILNYRPLTPMSSDPNDLQPLTAGHFLIGSPMNCIDDSDLPLTSKTRMWTKIKLLKSSFWNRWRKEYLAELQNRHKWCKEHQNIKIGTMVILKEINTPPLQWRMGRVTKTISDQVGAIRVVMVKTDSGELKRAIHEIAPLPVESDEIEPVVEESADIQQLPMATHSRKTSRSNNNLNQVATVSEPRMTRSKTKKSVRFSTITLLVFCFFSALILGSSGKPCKVVSFDSNPGLYFEEQGQISLTTDNWNIVCYTELSSYWNQSMIIKTILEKLDQICINITPNEYCNVTRKQLRTQLNIIQDKNELIQGFSQTRKRREWSTVGKVINISTLDKLEADRIGKLIDKMQKEHLKQPSKKVKRVKRGWINMIGSGMKRVTGVLDDNDAKHFEGKILDLNQETKHLRQLIANQTIMQEITQNIIRRDEAGFSRHLKWMENQLNVLQEKEAKIEVFNALALQATNLIQSHASIQNSIIEMITQTHQGKVSTTILTPIQLRQNMLEIAGNISKDLMIPGDDHRDNIAKVYATLSAQIRVTTTRIIIKISIPLLHRDFYKLYHMVPVPFVHKNSTLRIIELRQQYIGINNKQDHYYMLSHQQLAECKRYSEDLNICQQDHPLHSTQSGEALCEMAIYSHQSKGITPKCTIKQIKGKQLWSKLNSPNNFMFTVATPTNINFICKENSLTCTISNAGIITLPQDCMIQSQNMEITSHNVHDSEFPLIFVPGINITDVVIENDKLHHITNTNSIDTYKLDPELDLLQAAIQTQKLNENYTPMAITLHDVHQYAIIYIILIIVLVCIGWYVYINKIWLCTWFCCKLRSAEISSSSMVLPTINQPIPIPRSTSRNVVPDKVADEEISFS